VLVLGDSYTFGVLVDDAHTYCAQLERLFAGHQPAVEVLNAGYANGWETDEQYNWLQHRGLEFEPDVIVLGFFTGNDIMNLDPALWVERDQRGLPTKIVDPTIWVDNMGRLRSTRKDEKTVGDEWIYRVPVLRESHALVLLETRLESLFAKVRGAPVDPWFDGG
jgi:hypothetical protein